MGPGAERLSGKLKNRVLRKSQAMPRELAGFSVIALGSTPNQNAFLPFRALKITPRNSLAMQWRHRVKVSATAETLRLRLHFAAFSYCGLPTCATGCPFGRFPLLANGSARAHCERAVRSNSIAAIAGS